MERLGVTAFDASGTMRPLEDTFADLNTALSELTDQEKTAVLNEIFNKVDLKSVNALLGTSAERFDQLSGYISDCSNAAAEMAKTMDDNLKGDITILDSALEGLGIAAYEKFQEPFRETVQEVTGYVGVLTTELTDGELSGSVDKIAEGFNNLADAALRVVGDTIIPMIVSGFEAIVEYGSEIISVAAGIGAAFAAWKITNIVLAVIASIQKANLQLALLAAQSGAAAISQTALAGGLTLTEIAVALFTGKLTLATAATAAFNSVCSVNPIVLVVTALAAAAVALTTFALTADTTHNKLKKVNEEMEKISETTESSISSSQAEIAVIEAKMRKYEELRREYELTGKGEENLKALAEDLQQYMPNGIQLIDEQTGAYNSLAGSIENVSKSLLQKATIEAYEEKYTELIKQKIEAEKILNEASSELSDQSWFVGDFFDAVDYNDALEAVDDIESQILEVEAELDKLRSQDTTIHIGMDVQYELGGLNTGYKSASQMAAEEYANQRAEEAEELIALQDDINEKLKNKWSALEHNYAIGIIASEEELYQKKQELLDKYGNENLESHWQYYEDLFGYQQSYAEQSQQEYEQWLQDEWNSISHLQSLGLISSEQAYQQQLEFVSKYCGEYSDAWHSYYQTIIDYQREAQQKQVDGVRDSLSETVNEYKSAFSELESSVNSYKNRLLSVGDLISIVTEKDKDGNETTTYSVENLQKQMNAMQKYHDYIRQLKERDASEEILSELTSYDFEDSFYIVENFAKMSDAEFNKINELYAQREQLASDLADELYAPEMEQLNTDLINGVIAEFGTLPEEIRSIGTEALASFIEGISQTENLSEKVSEFTDSFFNACNEGISEGLDGIDIADSIAATLAEQDTYAIGKEKGDALVKGFNDALNALYAQFNSEQAYMSASVSYKQQPYQSASGSSSAGTSQTEHIVLENHVDTTVQLDSEKIGKASYKYIKEFERKSGT